MTEIGRLGGTPDKPARFFDSAEEFGAWLAAHHDTETELWMGLHKKHVPNRGLTWEDAVVEALCWGWIDSRAERIDEDSRRQRWTPRRQGSSWSPVNVALVEQLTAEGRMQPAGLAIFAARREDSSAPYSAEHRTRELPPAYAEQLASSPAAAAFWAEATSTYRRLATSWVLTAKQEATRDRRMAQLVQDCAAGRLINPQRYGTPPRWVERAAAAAQAAHGQVP